MKTKFGLFISLLLLLNISVWAAKWTIDSFDDSGDGGDSDDYIIGNAGADLDPVAPDKVTLGNNKLYVRQKFEDPFGETEATYQIFSGKPTRDAKNLGRITIEGMAYSKLLTMKLFYQKNATGDDDLETVYFDGKDILVEGDDPIYINLNGKMTELKPIVSKEYEISVTSEPAGAEVTVANVSKGETPATFTVQSSKAVTAVVSKFGYYPQLVVITPIDGDVTEEHLDLISKKPLNNPATDYRLKLQEASAAKDAAALKALKTEIQKTLGTYNSDTKKAIDAIIAGFPANPKKTSGEGTQEFADRQKVWTNTQTNEKNALNREGLNNFNELKELSAEIDAAIGDMDFTLRYEYIPNSAIQISNMGIRDFSVDTEYESPTVNFKYSNAMLSFGDVPKEELMEDGSGLHGVVKIWDVPDANGKYASIYDMAFFYDETPLQTLKKGTFSSPDATSASKTKEKDLNSRITKYAGKAAWDTKDAQATLATLQSGGGSGAIAASDDAYYDEEDDEEAFDEEMDEQESYDYSRYGAAGNATDIFDSKSSVFYVVGAVFAAAAIGSIVKGILEMGNANDAEKYMKDAENLKTAIGDEILLACNGDESCKNTLVELASKPPPSDPVKLQEYNDANSEICASGGCGASGNPRAIYLAEQARAQNKKAMDTHKTNSMIWFGIGAASAVTGVVLFAW